MRLELILDIIDTLIKEVIEINNKLYKRGIKKRYIKGTIGFGRIRFFTKGRRSKREIEDLYRLKSIELNFIKKGTLKDKK